MKGNVMKAIREYCLDCCCNQPGEVRKCASYECPLYPYRMGKDPTAVRNKNESPNYDEHTFDFAKKENEE